MIPVNFAPTENGNLVLEKRLGEVKARVATAKDRELHRERFTSHFATCAHAKQWRGSGRA